ncbi:MAG: hypothetical protein B6I28_01955 [Fusobacteriia bacterium 4572_132]|nr:MAG: hypothetical protein B6I28_01955 [Fusobacteriia bacterium 4572_132]
MDDRLYYEIELKCPVCGYKHIMTKTKSKIVETMPIGIEDYLIPIYSDEYINPLSYEIDICPKCMYAAFHKDFKEGVERHKNIVRTFHNDLKLLTKGVKTNTIYRNNEMARLSYVLAGFIYSKEKPLDYIKLGKCYTRIAWYSKELKEIEFYKKAIKMALESYIGAYNEITDPKASAIIMYMVSALYIELGDYEAATPYVNKLNGNMENKNLKEIKEKLENITIKLRKELKEIQEAEKKLSKVEKLREREKRKKAIEIEITKVPFGIDLKEINERLLKERKSLNELKGEKIQKKDLRPTILIVDDVRIEREILKKILKKNYNIIGEAEDGYEAIQKFKKIKPEIVILGVEIPKINGIKVLKEIKKINIKTKVIMSSGNKKPKIVLECLKNGALNYLIKPINENKLLETLKKS